MSDNRKPVWSLIAIAVLIGLPLLYVVSFGPATCLDHSLDSRPLWLDIWIRAPDPIYWVIDALPKSQSDRIYVWYRWTYLRWWRELGNRIAVA